MKVPLLLLHGALGASHQLKAIADQLSENYAIHLFDLPGHGGTALQDQPFSIPFFAEAVRTYIQQNHLQKATLFGHSMGGYIAMYVARHHPELIGRVITLGTKFHWDEAVTEKEIKMLDADAIAQKVPVFAASLAKTHAPADWKVIVSRTAAMLVEMGKDNPLRPEDYKAIDTPSLILLGDRDKMVTFEETIAVYKSLPNAKLAVLPGTPHAVEQVDPAMIAFFCNRS